MNFGIGDRVKFLDDVGKGTVIGLVDKEMVIVRTDDGFEYPVLKKDLIISDQPVQVQEKKGAVPAGKPTVSSVNTTPQLSINQPDTEIIEGPLSVLFGIQPLPDSSKQNNRFALHLINDSQYRVFYHAARGSDKRVTIIKAGYIEPQKSVRLGSCGISFLTEKNNSFYFQIIAYRNTEFTRIEPLSSNITLSAIELSTSENFRKNRFIPVNSYLIPVEQSLTRKLKMSLDDFKSAMTTDKKAARDLKQEQDGQVREQKKSDFQEIDLHIEQITDKVKGLTSGEIIEIQLARFKTALDGAILAGERKIVFIHGLGAGKLKTEIRKVIDKDYLSCRYQDASFQEYGYGATLILINQAKRTK